MSSTEEQRMNKLVAFACALSCVLYGVLLLSITDLLTSHLRPSTTLSETVVSIVFGVCRVDVGSVKTEHVVEDLSAIKQPSSGLGRRMSTVAADELSAFLPGPKWANKGICK